MVELIEYDSASDDDFMGCSSFATTGTKEEDEYLFMNNDEDSVYKVKIKITPYRK